MKRVNLLTIRAFASVLIFLLPACAEDPLGGDDPAGGGYTITLRLAASVSPIPGTKVTATPARPGSETEKADFYYEMVSSDADAEAATPGFSFEMESCRPDSVVVQMATKAASRFKNTYALLFTSTGVFNGFANIGAFTPGIAMDITFTKVTTLTDTGSRLVIVANDNAAVTPYASSAGIGHFDKFTGSYADFQKLTIANEIKIDEDVPYAGDAIFNLSLGEIGATIDISVSRTLAKVTLNNSIFKIIDGPGRSNITLHNAGALRFAPSGANKYDGTGTTQTTTGFVATTAGGNVSSVTWYVGENIQPAIASIKTPADRNNENAPKDACYIRIASAALSVAKNTSPKIGEEYTQGGSKSFTYDLYLGKSSNPSDFALRRHTNYTINTEISGTLAAQEQLAETDGRVTLTKPESAGLVIGRFGGPVGYTAGTGPTNEISGLYSKFLLLEPNTTRTTATDNIAKVWGAEHIPCQPETRKHWDRTYIYDNMVEGTIGGMSTAADGLYAYCNELTLGGVSEGVWYVPTQAQLQAIHAVRTGLEEGDFNYYAAFYNEPYWSCTAEDTDNAWYMMLRRSSGGVWYINRTLQRSVRCVRDALATEPAGQYVAVVNGYPVIDLLELSPLGCVLTSGEAVSRCTEINSQTPSNTACLPAGIAVTGETGTWNAKMSSRFQLMRTGFSFMTWASAYDACKEYEGEGGKSGQWRLPTQRELEMIWVLHPQLLGKGGYAPSEYGRNWTCTESDATRAWICNFENGNMSAQGNTKDYGIHVRCIRDL